MEHKLIIAGLAALPEAAEEFKQVLRNHSLIAFHAPMGAGKTTFTKALCESLGVPSEELPSPTSAIVNEYMGSDGNSIFHFDFYRITKNEEALDIGIYDYFDSGCLCLMEWAENIPELLPDETLHVNIQVAGDGSRVLSWED